MGDIRVAVLEPQKPKPLDELVESPNTDLRVYAMAPASISMFKELGIWESVCSRAQAYDSMQIWDGSGDAFVRFDSSEVGVSQLGYIMENSVLTSALLEKAASLSGRVDVLCPAKVESIVPPGAPPKPSSDTAVASEGQQGEWGAYASGTAWPQVTLSNGQTINARLLVAADGGNSAVRRACGMGTWGWDYDHHALVTTLAMETPHSTAWQRFLPSGPLALLPLPGSRSSIVWSTSPQHAAHLKALPPDQFLHEFHTAMHGPACTGGSGGSGAAAAAAGGGGGVGSPLSPLLPLLQGVQGVAEGALSAASHAASRALSGGGGGATTVAAALAPPCATSVLGPRVSFPLRLSHASEYASERVALVGDAAHSMHVLAGQGLNFGIGDADRLASVLEEGVRRGQDLGSLPLLQQYAQERRAANLAMSVSLDTVKRLFGCGPGPLAPTAAAGNGVSPATAMPEQLSWPLVSARNAGMRVLQSLSPVKSAIARTAMGL